MDKTEIRLGAEVCWRDHFGSEGAAREYLVRLPSGFLLSCGIDGYSQKRAVDLSRTINESAQEPQA